MRLMAACFRTILYFQCRKVLASTKVQVSISTSLDGFFRTSLSEPCFFILYIDPICKRVAKSALRWSHMKQNSQSVCCRYWQHTGGNIERLDGNDGRDDLVYAVKRLGTLAFYHRLNSPTTNEHQVERIKSTPCSAKAYSGTWRWPEIGTAKTLASTTLSPSTPKTFKSESTTSPMANVPAG